MSDDTIPVIHLTPWVQDKTQRQELITQIRNACQEWGFFQVIGHPISAELILKVWPQVKEFFSLPNQLKQTIVRTRENSRGWYNRELTKNTRDMKEVFDFGYLPHPELPDGNPANKTEDGINQWPDPNACPLFRSIMWEFFLRCEQLAVTLLAFLLEGLHISESQFGQTFFQGHTSFLRLNYYPKSDPLKPEQQATDSGHMGVHHHTDAGILTILLQDDIGGLQVHHSGNWINVNPVKGALVVNIGDMVQVWTNDLYKAPLHRVVASDSHPRYSLPFFYNPPYHRQIAPIASLTSEKIPPKYRPIPWGEFRLNRQQGDFANYGQENQIQDYLISKITTDL